SVYAFDKRSVSSGELITGVIDASHFALRTCESGLLLALLTCNWQMDRERAAFARLAPHSDLALMGHDDVFDQRQSEAATLHVMNQAGADPVKFLENLLLLVSRYADPAVGDCYGYEAVGLGDADVDLFHVAGIFDRVVEQVCKRERERVGVKDDFGQRVLRRLI